MMSILKNQKKMKKILFLFCFSIIAFTASYAQTISYPVFAQSITRGLDSSLLTVRIDFPACNNPIVNIKLGYTENAEIIEYIPSSITQIDGTLGLTIGEFNISNLSSPTFKLNTTASNKFIVFSIKRRANCGIATTTKDAIFVTGDCNFSDTDPDANEYLLKSPILTLIAPPSLNNIDAGATYNRVLSITNGGNGCIDTLFFWIKYPAGSMQLNSLKIGSTTIFPSFTNGDSLLFKITSTSFFGADNKMCNGETINLTENVTVKKCNANTTYGTFWNNYFNLNCEAIILTSGITMSNNTPNLAVTVPTPNYDYCFKGESIIQKMRVTNTGSGTGANIVINMSYLIPGSGSGYVFFDTTKAWVVRNNLGDSIGVMKNFTSVTTLQYYTPTCTVLNAMATGIGTLEGVLIPAGTYVDIDVPTVAYNFACAPNACYYADGWAALQTSMTYKNQCGTANYNQGPVNQYHRFYFLIVPTIEVPTSITPGPFTMNIDFSNFRTMNHPNGSGTTYLIMPLPTSITPGASTVNLTTSIAGANYTYNMSVSSPYSSSTDTLWIGPITQNISLYNDVNMKIPLIATCGASGTKTFDFQALDRYSPCSPLRKFNCSSVSTSLSCPDYCPKGGATPLAFSLKRINFGLPDNDNNHLPDASGAIDFTKINDHHSVNGDTLRGTWNIKIHPNVDVTDPNYGQSVRYVYVDFDLGSVGLGLSGTVNALPNAKIKIYPNSNALATPITCTVTPTIIGTKAHYEFATTCRTGFWQQNDSMVIEALYTVNDYNAGNLGNYNVSGFSNFTTNAEVYSTYTQKTTPQIAPVLGQTYTCYHINDYNQISRIWLSDYIPANQVIDGCSVSLISYMRQYIRNQEGPNIFPYEYRTFGSYETMKVTLPPGFAYKPNSAIIYTSNYVSASAVFSDANILQVGNVLFFNNIKSSFTNFGGTIVPGDETESIYFTFKADPTCTAVSGVYPSNTITTISGNGVNTPSTAYNYTTGYGIPSGWIYSAPQPALAGSGIVQSTDGTATWNVNVQNQSNRVAAPNSFIYITPINSLLNIVVKEGATVITPDVNGFYRLGILATSANRNLTITANSGICTSDSIKINYGWNCSGYPSSFATVGCTLSSWLGINNYQSQIQLGISKQPDPVLANCSGETIEIVMGSAQAAFSKNPILKLTPPAGLNFSQAQLEYPLNSGNWQTVLPTVTGNIYAYNIQDHAQLTALWGAGKGLPGTIDNPTANGRQVKLKITYGVDCSYQNGSKISIQQKADRPCGDPVSDDYGYNKIIKTDPIFVSPTSICITGDTNFTIAPQVGNVQWKDLPWSLGHVPTPCESAQITFTGTGATAEVVTVNVTTNVNIKNLILLNKSTASVSKVFKTLVEPGITMFMNGNVTMSAAAASSMDSVIFNTKANGLMTVTGYTKIGYPADNAYSIFGAAPTATTFFDYILKGDLIFNEKGLNRAKYTNITFEVDDTVRIVNNTNPTIYPNAVMFDKLTIGNLTAPIAILQGTNQNDFVYDNGGYVKVNDNAKLILNANYSINAKDVNVPNAFFANFFLNNNAKLIVRGDNGGTTGSNFPKNFSVYTLHTNSTVDYNGSSNIIQTVYGGATYGKLILSKENGTARASKNSILPMNIRTSLIVNSAVDFNLGENVASPGSFTVQNTAGLYCNANVVSGVGVFTLGDSCYFGSGHPQGIHPLGVAQGNIQMTGGRTFTSTSNYIYNGTATQITGNGLPLNVNEFTVDNPTVVNNTKTLVVNSFMKMAQGVFDINTTKITSNGAGTIISVTGKIKADVGIVEMKGNTGVAQTLSGNLFVNKTVGILTNANTKGIIVAAVPADTLLIAEALDYNAVTGSVITTNDNLTLLSRLNKTANFGNATGNTIVGKVNVERYMFARSAWRLLATPIQIATSPTVSQAWRENNGTHTATGYGTRITGPGVSFSSNTGVLDDYSINPSMKSYNAATNNFTGITNANITPIANTKGYYVFVRGDRSAAAIMGLSGITNLRIKGDLRTGDQVFPVPANKFESIGNPFASRIDMRTVNKTNVVNAFYVWNPNNTGLYNVGSYEAYVYNSTSGNYKRVGDGLVRNYIESGEAFYVQSNVATAGSYTIKETDKGNGSANVSRLGETMPTLDVVLYAQNADSSMYITDGVKMNFDNSYSTDIDNEDVRKINNSYDNIALKNGTTNLIVERRGNLQPNDTIKFNLSGMRIANYRLDIDPSVLNYQGLEATFVDKFLQSRTPVSLTDITSIAFTTTADAASRAADRFMLVFKKVTSVSFINIAAERTTDKAVKINWTVDYEVGVDNYTIEQSNDGINFTIIATENTPINNASVANYSYLHKGASVQKNWYRIKANTASGTAKYSAIALVNEVQKTITAPSPSIAIALKAGMVNVILKNELAGKYNFVITNSAGQVIKQSLANVNNASFTHNLQIGEIASGNYQLTVINTNGEKTTIAFLVM
jgi:hypothetical protein